MAGFRRIVAKFLCVLVIAVGEWSSKVMVGATPPLPDCKNELIPLQSCLPYVTGEAPSPTTDCCSGVLDVHQTDPTCLCVLAQNDSTTIIIPSYRLDLAGKLPAVCKIQGASISNCPALLGETNRTSPATGPALSTGDTGAAYRLKTSTNLRSLIFTYFGIVMAATVFFSNM